MPADSPLAGRVRARLDAIGSRGLLRTLRPPAGIDLSSNDYLNLSAHPRVRAAFAEGLAREGCGSTGSRLLRGERAAFSSVEAQFARFKGSERALFFSSGYLANLAVLSGLTEPGDVIFSDVRNHASLIDGARLSRARTVVVPHGDPAALAERMASTACEGVRFVVVESLYSMDGDIAPLADYAARCAEAGACLIVDEAHAVGIYGTGGTGLLEAAGVEPGRVISVNTAGKALGVGGAFVAGPDWAIECLIQQARPFVFTTAPPPAMADALSASLTLVEAEPERRARLASRAAYLRRRLREAGIDVPAGTSQIIPVLIGDNMRAVEVARAVQADGFDVRAIRPPSVPRGTARLRLSVNAGLSEATLDHFVQVLASELGRHPVTHAGLASA